MTATLSIALLVAACVGSGATVLRGLRITFRPSAFDRIAWSFAVGLGVVGWLLFFPALGGYLDRIALGGLLGFCTLGLFFLKGETSLISSAKSPSVSTLAVAAVLATSFALSLLEGLSPPTDADSLAYHFALPKQFLTAGRLEFVPRALDGAVPLLLQMTYTAALALGGEKGLTLWTAVSSWGAAALLYTVARRHLDRTWSLALAASFYTLPAAVYGSGSGQVEVRLSMFAMVAMMAVAEALRTQSHRYAVLAGLACGFFIGGKLTGLLFAGCCGVALLFQRRWLTHGTLFGAVTAGVGAQWLVWTWAHTGDPIFPFLFGTVPYHDPSLWNPAQDAFFRAKWNEGESPLPKTLLGLLAYPARATFDPLPAFESGRTGFGPLPILLLPFAGLGLWQARDRLARSTLLPVAGIVAVFYVAWFFLGPSQRIRHLLPLLPAVLLCLGAAAVRWAQEARALIPLGASVGLALTVQTGGQVVYSARYIRHLATGESRDAFLARSVLGYPAVQWMNENLSPKSYVITNFRTLTYLLSAPAFHAYATLQAVVDLKPGATAGGLISAARKLGASYILAIGDDEGSTERPTLLGLAQDLVKANCARFLASIPIPSIETRTFPGPPVVRMHGHVIGLELSRCL